MLRVTTMKIKTFHNKFEESYEEMDDRVNEFIACKQVTQIATAETVQGYGPRRSITILYDDFYNAMGMGYYDGE